MKTKTKRRINFTGRKRINKKDIDIRLLHKNPNSPLTVTMKLKMDCWRFPETSQVVLEAYHRNSGMRFDCGTVANLKIPEIRLDQLDPAVRILFRLKIVDGDSASGRLLGSAERIAPAEDEHDDYTSEKTILPILNRDLGAELAKIDFNDAGATLLLNSNVPDFSRKITEDPFLAGTLLPQAFKIVLSRVFKEWDSEPWQEDWIRFCTTVLQMDDPEYMLQNKGPTTEWEIDDWIDKAVRAFCEQHKFFDGVKKYCAK